MTESDSPIHASEAWGGRLAVLTGGVLLVVSLALPWYGGNPSTASSLSGFALSSPAPELGVLPALGILAVAGGAMAGRLPERSVSLAAPAAIFIGLLGLLTASEAGARLSSSLVADYGRSFWDGVSTGWYLATGGAFLLVAAGVVRWSRLRTGSPAARA